jgi:hypothetical protein
MRDTEQYLKNAVEIGLRTIKQKVMLEISRRLSFRNRAIGYGNFRDLEQFERFGSVLSEILSDGAIDNNITKYVRELNLEENQKFETQYEKTQIEELLLRDIVNHYGGFIKTGIEKEGV